MLKIILSGCSGKMGRVITDIVANDPECEIVAGVDPYTASNTDYPVYTSFENLPTADVIIDFSNPAALDGMLEFANKFNMPTVICTTGYNDTQIEKINAAAKNIPIFFSFNMSLGINLLVSLAKKATAILGDDYDIEIIEKHHNQKIDAPSGTAIMLANAINETMDGKMIYEYDRHSKREKRSKNEIGIHSVRGGTIVGEHEVIFAGDNEVVSLTHQAFSKNVFAFGAVKAAKFLKGKTAGIYDMNGLISQ
ncbi:MAG: 4-hydroxy-tetrahydrodipicolinate reductase [Acutalibacteraceae bacterium]|nr:4-hydroxy-tetrahydrodipicolinate reductase [Acutalibacteraceae bacterium]